MPSKVIDSVMPLSENDLDRISDLDLIIFQRVNRLIADNVRLRSEVQESANNPSVPQKLLEMLESLNSDKFIRIGNISDLWFHAFSDLLTRGCTQETKQHWYDQLMRWIELSHSPEMTERVNKEFVVEFMKFNNKEW